MRGLAYGHFLRRPKADDWQRHFGGFQDARRRYDPARILTAGYLAWKRA